MNAQDVQHLIGLVPASSAALRAALAAGQIKTISTRTGLRFQVPTGTLDDSAYDLFRPTEYLLSCVSHVDGMDVAYITRKDVKPTPFGLCYHATAASKLLGIRTSGLIIGRNVPGAKPRAGAYSDSKQYIHACASGDRATEYWYYDHLGNDQAGVVLEIDLNTANCVLLEDPRSDDGIIQATSMDPRHIKCATHLPSVADMQRFLQTEGWMCEENAITMAVKGNRKGLPASTSGYTLPGAWRKFHQGVKAGNLP